MRPISSRLSMILGCLLLAVSLPLVAAEKVYRLKLAETWPPNYPILGDTTKNLAAIVEKMSNGRLIIRIDSKNKHKAPLGIFDMVKAGQYDIGHSASYYWKGKDP
ncbi:ABC transporter substrate-binding protein, partial [Solemya velum gill symbiont]